MVVGLAVLLAIYTLPSALNLPQANPGQVAEYAPVPGNSNSAPPGGNFAGLGLGQGGTPQGGSGGAGTAGTGGEPEVPNGVQCVGNPPRQTEDPLSPPCVPYYKGDNGGSTWEGVSRHEITVVVRYARTPGSCRTPSAYSNNCGAPSGYYDMDSPSSTNGYNADFMFTFLHYWSIYFNKRYQTYGRYVHFWVYNFGDSTATTYDQSTAAAEAADNFNHVHPFADISQSVFPETYTEYMAQHNVLSFGFLSQALASKYPGLYWNFLAPPEYTAQLFATYVCKRMIETGKTSYSGTYPNGTPRKYGLLLTDDPAATDIQNVQNLAVQAMKKDCNFSPADVKYFHYTGAYNTSGPKSGWGTMNMTAFKTENITTVIWPGGIESEDMSAADNLQYYPEWMLLGDGATDGNLMSLQPKNQMLHAWVVSPTTLQNADGIAVEPACWEALTSVDPTISRSTGDPSYACDGVWTGNVYDDLRQLFTGIQLAGPHLTPASMNQGFHAIPAKPSTGPSEPACFYYPGDYTCVKDGVAEWFDPNTPEPATDSTGCWRMWEQGARFLPGQWPAGDVTDGKDPNDVCNLTTGSGTFSFSSS